MLKHKLILFGLFLFLCSCKKNVNFLGFAYKNDTITISKDNNEILNIVPNSNGDKNRLCHLYENLSLISFGKDIKLKIVIDSNQVKLLDTIIIIRARNKEPFISFLYPSKKQDIKGLSLLQIEQIVFTLNIRMKEEIKQHALTCFKCSVIFLKEFSEVPC
ncbi:hypothetical protein D3C80_1282560 [compost metagenome]